MTFFDLSTFQQFFSKMDHIWINLTHLSFPTLTHTHTYGQQKFKVMKKLQKLKGDEKRKAYHFNFKEICYVINNNEEIIKIVTVD